MWSYPHLSDLLYRLLTSSNPPVRIHLMAHSLGNRVMLPALQFLAIRHPDLMGPNKRIGSVLFMAADVDIATFIETLPAIGAPAEHITVYRSSIDTVIFSSRTFHEHPRLGLVDSVFTGAPQVETLDASTFLCEKSGHFSWKKQYARGA